VKVSKRTKDNSGFSIFEILIVIAMVLAVVVMAGPFLAGSLSRNELKAFSEEAADALKEARSSAMTGRAGGKYGVHFEASKFVFFEGETYSAADPDNVDHDLSGFVDVGTIDISGGGNDIHFQSVSGSAVETGTITFSDASGETRTVTVNEVGLIDIQ
jgi:Tfp pilus assembly protein FimT